MATKPRKPSKYQSAYTQQLKELQKIVKKAQRKGIELSPSYTPPTPKRITQASIRKVERLSMKASVIVESTIRKQRTKTSDLSKRNRPLAQVDIPVGTNLLERKLAAQTRKEREARMSFADREKLRQIRAERFKKAMAKVDRKAVAQKAAQTRKAREALLSRQEREELHRKRSEQARKSARRRSAIPVTPISTGTAPQSGKRVSTESYQIPEQENWLQEADVIYKNVLKSIENITQQYQNAEQSEFHYLNAQGLKRLLDDYIKEKGYEVVMELIHEQSHLFIKATEAILYASDQSIIDWGLTDLVSILSGKPLSLEYAKEIAELKEQMNSLEEVDSEEAWEDIKKFGW